MKKLISFLLVVLSFHVNGEHLVFIGSTDIRSDYYLDTDSISVDGDLVKHHEFVNYYTPLKFGDKNVVSSHSTVMSDCKNRRERTLSLIDYSQKDGLGSVVNIDVTPHDWYVPIKGSISEVFFNKVCENVK